MRDAGERRSKGITGDDTRDVEPWGLCMKKTVRMRTPRGENPPRTKPPFGRSLIGHYASASRCTARRYWAPHLRGQGCGKFDRNKRGEKRKQGEIVRRVEGGLQPRTRFLTTAPCTAPHMLIRPRMDGRAALDWPLAPLHLSGYHPTSRSFGAR
jgi:hypothetical protein